MATNRAPEVEAIAGVFLFLTWATSCLRIYVKGFMAKSFALEDWLAILALFFFTASAIFALEGISHSMGLHLAQVPPQNLVPAMQYWFSVELAYVLATCTLKMSIGVFLLRIANKRSHKLVLYITMGVVVALTTAYFLFLVFQCKPVDYYWNVFAGEAGHCLDAAIVGGFTYAHSAVNAAADVVLALLPVVIVSQLQMNPRTKITVCIILALGLVACAAVIARIPYVKILVDDADDFLYASTDVVIWSAIEPGLAITAANMATLRPLFSVFLSRTKLWGTTTHNKSSYGYSKNFSAFSSRKGYMRSGSRGNTNEMGLQDMDKSGLTTTVEAKDSGTYGNKHIWDSDVEAGSVFQDNTLNEWPSEIRKTIRLDIVSENVDEENYGSTLSKMTEAARRERSTSNIMRSHKMEGSGDLGRPLVQGLTRVHVRQSSGGSGLSGGNSKAPQLASTSLAMRPGLKGSQSILGVRLPQGILRSNVNSSQANSGQEYGSRSTPFYSNQHEGLPRENAKGSRSTQVSSLKTGTIGDLSQLQTHGLPRASPNGSQASLDSSAAGKLNNNGNGSDSPVSLGRMTRGTGANASRRISHIYQGSEGGVVRGLRGES